MNFWITSDQHFGHANIVGYCGRPFTDVEEMDREMIARHNAAVAPADEVWHLGDFSLNEKMVPQILPRLNGHHKLVTGNHDRCHPCHKKSEAARRRYLLYGFESVVQELHVGPWLFNHLPYTEDSAHEGRYPEWRPKDQGSWLAHGHIHEIRKIGKRQVNVGVDVWNFAPVHFSVLEAIRMEGTGQ